MNHPMISEEFIKKFNQLSTADNNNPSADTSPHRSLDRGPLSPSIINTAPPSAHSLSNNDSSAENESIAASPQTSPSTNNTPIHSTPNTPTHLRGVPDYRKLFVSNLSFVTTPDDLENVFRIHGPCEIRLQSDPLTGRSLGYAFVSFETPEAAASAKLSSSGMIFQGRALRIEYAVQKFHKPQSFFHAGIKKFERSGKQSQIINNHTHNDFTAIRRIPSLSSIPPPRSSSARHLPRTSSPIIPLTQNSLAAASAAAAAGLPFISYANPSTIVPLSIQQTANVNPPHTNPLAAAAAAAAVAANAGREDSTYAAYAAAAAQIAAASTPPNLFHAMNYVPPPSSSSVRPRSEGHHAQAAAAAQMAAAAAAYHNYNYQLNAAAAQMAALTAPTNNSIGYIAPTHNRHSSAANPSVARPPISGDGSDSFFHLYGQNPM